MGVALGLARRNEIMGGKSRAVFGQIVLQLTQHVVHVFEERRRGTRTCLLLLELFLGLRRLLPISFLTFFGVILLPARIVV